MSLSLEELKAEFKQESENKTNFQSALGEWYPFWKADFDSIATFRFLPFANPELKNFLVEKHMHKLMVVLENGQTVQRQIPCLAQFGKTCPSCQTSQKFYAEEDQKNGSAFYKKKSWVGHGLVVESPFEYDNPENPHKKISVGWQVYQAIKTGIMHDVEHHPIDLLRGYDFRIMKVRGPDGKPSYTQSRFAPKSTPVDEKILESLTLYDPEDVLPKEPTLDNMNAMLTSALTGEIYTSPGRSNSDTPTAAFKKPASETPASPPVSGNSGTLPWEDDDSSATEDSATAVEEQKETSAPSTAQAEDAILAAIRSRKPAKTSAE